MRFKIDENLPIEITEMLSQAGHNVQSVYDENLTGCTDMTLASVCQTEQRTIITMDLDFADIRNYPPEAFTGLIVLRLKSQDKIHVLKIFRRLMRLFSEESLDRKLWIVDEQNVRIRE